MTGPKNEQSDFDVAALFDALDVQRRDRGLGIWISSQFVPSESVNWREIAITLKSPGSVLSAIACLQKLITHGERKTELTQPLKRCADGQSTSKPKIAPSQAGTSLQVLCGGERLAMQ